MARLLHWSDLHLEFKSFALPDLPEPIDALLLAGDTGPGGLHIDFLEQAWEKYQVPIISIWGNHELYGTSFEELKQTEEARLKELKAKGYDIRVLHAETTRVKDAVIFGTTLWTDYRLYPGQVERLKEIGHRGMADFKAIRLDIAGKKLTPDYLEELHFHQRKKLVDAMRMHRQDNLVVMTHHMPHPNAMELQYIGGGLSASFCSNLDEEIRQYHPDFWIFGHTHGGTELDIETEGGITSVRQNQRGYPFEAHRFDPFRMIDTLNPDVRRL